MEKIVDNNTACLVGKVIQGPIFNHKTFGEVYYMIYLGVLRKSGYEDKIRILVSDSLLCGRAPIEGDVLEVIGQIRTYNKESNRKSTLEVTIFAKSIEHIKQRDFNYENKMVYEGFLCKRPVRRTSPLGRELCDLMVAVNRQYGKSDYIPTIAWGKNAVFCEILDIGDKVTVWGRIQSREYRKLTDDEEMIIKTAYEVSVVKIEAE